MRLSLLLLQIVVHYNKLAEEEVIKTMGLVEKSDGQDKSHMNTSLIAASVCSLLSSYKAQA